jgi:N utilization substance protein B
LTTQRRSRNLRIGPVGRQARVLALQVLCASDVRGVADPGVLDWLCDEEPAGRSVRRTATGIIDAVTGDAAALDATIQRLAPAIPVNLLAVVDRNILRVAIYELYNRQHLPRHVVVSEAVELASTFGSESSARFVNGVLGSVLDDMTAGAQAPVEPA